MNEGALNLADYLLPDVPLRLIALIKTEDLAKKILTAMHLPSDVPQLRPARPPRPPVGDTGRGDDWLN